MTFSLSGQRNCLIISPLSSLGRQTTAILNTSPGNALSLPAFCLLTRVKSRRLGSEERHQIARRPGLSALAPTSGGACDLEVHNRAIQITPTKVERLESYRLRILCFGPARVSYHGVVRYHAQWNCRGLPVSCHSTISCMRTPGVDQMGVPSRHLQLERHSLGC